MFRKTDLLVVRLAGADMSSEGNRGIVRIGGMNTDSALYRHTQFGWPIALAVAAVLGVLGFVLVVVEPGDRVPAGFLAVAGVVIGVLWAFSRLLTEVTPDQLRVAFRPGWPRRTIPLDHIRSARAVRTAWYWGWGIRLTPRGWLWNVSGLSGVEIELDGGKRFRVGTDDPDGLLRALVGEGVREDGG